MAVLVAGDADYVPVLQRIRRMGKRVQLVAMNPVRGHAISSKTLVTAPSCFDFPHIFMDEHANEFRLQREMQKRACMSCGVEEETTWGGEEFYCAACRAKRARKVRQCDNCGKEEETTWDKDFFYCSSCRANYRAGGDSAREEVPAEKRTMRATLTPTVG